MASNITPANGLLESLPSVLIPSPQEGLLYLRSFLKANK
jgi:hypothetical protein